MNDRLATIQAEAYLPRDRSINHWSRFDDPDLDGLEFSTINHTVTSTGGKYANVTNIDSIEFVVYDDETAGALVEQTDGSTIISTDGTTDTYRVRLTAAPAPVSRPGGRKKNGGTTAV